LGTQWLKKSIRLGQGAFGWVALHRDIRLGRERWVASKQPNPEVQQDLAQELMLNELCLQVHKRGKQNKC
jgi:hypothetical protein